MTQAPTPGPLDSESVKLLVKGDLLRVTTPGIAEHFGPVVRFERAAGDIIRAEGLDHHRGHFDFIGRPHAGDYGYGWVEAAIYPEPEGVELARSYLGASKFWRPFRLAPTAPVEASGSEREAWACVDFSPDLRMSGEGYCLRCGRHQDEHAHPLALGGQHSTATDFPPDDVLACVDDTTPARAEAQDEGAAGKPVAYGADHQPWCQPGDQTDRAFRLRFEDPDMREMVWTGPDAEREALAAYNQYAPSWNVYLFSGHPRAHPSPTPAADADRVLVPLEPTPEMHAAGVAVTEKRLAPSWTAREVYRAMTQAALKSTAAKEGGKA